jgi:hypothetical protein
MICAGDPDARPRRDTCSGDSGSPLLKRTTKGRLGWDRQASAVVAAASAAVAWMCVNLLYSLLACAIHDVGILYFSAQVGIVSWGYRCAGDKPAVYTNVSWMAGRRHASPVVGEL